MGIRIDIELLTGAAREDLKRLAGALDGFNGRLLGTRSNLRSTASAARGGGGGSRPGSRPPVMRKPVFQNIHDEIAWLQSPAGANRHGWRRNDMIQRLQNKLNPPDPFMAALMRTRFVQGAFGKLKAMPLGRDLAQFAQGAFGMGGGGMAGMGKFAGPAAAILLPLALNAKMAGDALKRLSDKVNSFPAMGSNPRTNEVAMRIGAMVGDPNAASRIQQGIEAGGGASVAARAGVNIVGGPFGDNDYSEKYIKIARLIANASSYDQARRDAEHIGMPELANLNLLSDGQKDRLFNGRTAMNSLADQQRMIQAKATMAEAAEIWNRIKERAILVAAKFVLPFLKAVEKFMDILEWIAHLPEMLAEQVRKWFPGLAGGPRKGSAIDRNTAALDENTRAMKEGRSFYGNAGPRAQGAIPKGLHGIGISDGVHLNVALGAL